MASRSAFQKECRNQFRNITIKKIPQVLLGKCEFNHDDYSLHIITPPTCEEEPDYEEESNYGEESDIYIPEEDDNQEPQLF